MGFIVLNKVVGSSFPFVGRYCAPFGVVEVVSALIEMARHYSGRPRKRARESREAAPLNEKRSIPAYGMNIAKHCSC